MRKMVMTTNRVLTVKLFPDTTWLNAIKNLKLFSYTQLRDHVTLMAKSRHQLKVVLDLTTTLELEQIPASRLSAHKNE